MTGLIGNAGQREQEEVDDFKSLQETNNTVLGMACCMFQHTYFLWGWGWSMICLDGPRYWVGITGKGH